VQDEACRLRLDFCRLGTHFRLSLGLGTNFGLRLRLGTNFGLRLDCLGRSFCLSTWIIAFVRVFCLGLLVAISTFTATHRNYAINCDGAGWE